MTLENLRRTALLGALAVFLGVYFSTPVQQRVATKLAAWNYATAIADGMKSTRLMTRMEHKEG